ncbi:ABC transporter permease subunit [Actinacidiphila acididurans]|uniref:ABC transporter permease n=1 Tax=Actinacidiphila acididurans TaxID=2784346 RepID=A0ABS2TRP6_9ACTN|nr:ABC transporter permease [Actinacidiphila acididurans]MBM9506013.1 ABC transporter permease [Actinacidiphila acididurans]
MSATTATRPPGPPRPPAGIPAAGSGTGPRFFHPTVARLTYRGLLGRRRALLLFALPALLLVIVGAVRALAGADDSTAHDVLQGFALSGVVPLVGVIAGTGAIGPEIDDGSIVYLLSKPIRRGTIVTTKLLVAIGVTVAFCAIPTLLAGFVLNGNGQRLAVAYAAASAVAAVAYSAVFLMLGVLTRHAVVVGLVYALLWEGVIGNVVPGARTLSVQQWAVAVAQKIGRGDLISSDVGLSTAVVLLVLVTAGATWFAAHRLRGLKITGEE